MLPVCPKCDVGLIVLHFKGIEVDLCNRCKGLWLDGGELEELLGASGAAPGDSLLDSLDQRGSFPRGRKYLCPRCDEPMPRIPLRLGGEQKDHLDIERCTHGHGLWCDDGELQRLLSMSPPRGRAHEVIDYLNQLLGAAQGE